MEKLGGVARRVTRETLQNALKEIVANERADKVIGYRAPGIQLPKFTELTDNFQRRTIEWLPAKKPADFDDVEYRRNISSADLAITTGDYLLAQIGTIVFLDRNHPSRLLTLLPPCLVVIAAMDSLLEDLSAFHTVLRETKTNQSTGFWYLTGPSRTADIEKTLVLGMHGPTRLYALVMDKGR